jgi:uncharacterized protein involved in type VI secretion and phage assembly
MEHVSGGAVPGVVPGVVVDLDDPKRLGRVKVTFPDLGDVPSDWCRIVTPSAGGGRGVMFRPEKGEEVMVCFERGDPRAPYLLGGVWNQTDKPPTDPDPVANDIRSITSRSGHVITLDDTKGKEKIEIVAHGGKQKVIIDTAAPKITVSAEAGDVEVSAAQGDVTLHGRTVNIKADQQLTLDCQGQVKVSGSTIQLN